MVRRGWHQVTSGWVQVLRGDLEQRSDLPEHKQHGNPQIKPVGRWCHPGAQSPETARERGHPDTALQEARRCGQFGSSLTSFQGPEVDVLKNTLSRAKQAIEGTAYTERRVHPAFTEANCQGSGSNG